MKPLVEVKGLKKYFNVGRNTVLKAVDDLSFTIYQGETLGLVGESGCGKTTCGRTILKLYEPTGGSIIYNGKDMNTKQPRSEIMNFKKSAQIIFQDPYSALDPRMTIEEIISEGISVHYRKTRSETAEIVNELLTKIGLTGDFANRFPHELSGGQRQRVGIARALAVNPDFIVCDEPISALDVSIQAQIVNLLISLQKERNLTYLFISHDLSMVKHISDRVGVMYLGNLVELADSETLFAEPKHPYTKALMSAILTADPDFEKVRERQKLQGEIPSPINPPSGCKFRTRCPYADGSCAQTVPELREVSPGHFTACVKE
ncbi:MAG: ATP-binding cassette domain-containing protein [Defluviitaleaceae bacterium]|nr:ATP-binding cassette domain-containing protein [Defluviitaleaceae bacterium]